MTVTNSEHRPRRRLPVATGSKRWSASLFLVTVVLGLNPRDLAAEESEPAPAPSPRGAPALRGVALGLFSADRNYNYERELSEAAALGSSYVSVVVTYFQRDVTSTKIYSDRTQTPSKATLRRTLQQAGERGLSVLLFPYVRVAERPSPNHWRGSIEPSDRDAWYESYGRWIEGLARLAAREGVEVLSLGSEMSSMDVDTDRWRGLIARVRRVYGGQVTYSANWDHYERVGFWNDVDLVGLTGYFELVPEGPQQPTLGAIVEGWREWHLRLMRWQATHGRRILLTEVGYRSNDGAAAVPWRWGTGPERVDVEEQRLAYEAFTQVWSHEPRLAGVFFWNWWGEGGAQCTDYTPRHKPAEAVLRRWLGGPPAPSPARAKAASNLP
jgi:hypothetical protein